MALNQVQTESSICNRKYVTNDLLKLPDNVSIICDDGEVRANMEILSVRSDFFARGFNNPGFMESQSKSIRMEGCTKAAMEAVKTYLYTGEMDFIQLPLDTLLLIMNVSREILIEVELFNRIESYIKTADTLDLISRANQINQQSCTKYAVFPRSLKLLDRFRFDNLCNIVSETSIHMATIILNLTPNDDEERDAIATIRRAFLQETQSLPMKIMKKLLLCEKTRGTMFPLPAATYEPWTKSRFEIFLAWYVANEESCTEEFKKEILGSFNYDHFNGEELVTVVGRSGLLPREEVERMVVERFRRWGDGNQ